MAARKPASVAILWLPRTWLNWCGASVTIFFRVSSLLFAIASGPGSVDAQPSDPPQRRGQLRDKAACPHGPQGARSIRNNAHGASGGILLRAQSAPRPRRRYPGAGTAACSRRQRRGPGAPAPAGHPHSCPRRQSTACSGHSSRRARGAGASWRWPHDPCRRSEGQHHHRAGQPGRRARRSAAPGRAGGPAWQTPARPDSR